MISCCPRCTATWATFAWALLVNAPGVECTGGVTELTPETFEEALDSLGQGQRLFVDFSQNSMYRKLFHAAAESDTSKEVTWAVLNCGPHHLFCSEKQLRPWNALRFFFGKGGTDEYVEFPLAVLSEIQEDSRWEKLVAFVQASSEESAENLADMWKSEWSNTRPPHEVSGIDEIRNDNYEAAFNWLLAHDSRQLFMLYTGVQKPCQGQREHLLAALQDVPPDVPVKIGVVNCDTDPDACKAASVAAYCFMNHFNTGNACAMNIGGPRGSAHFRGPMNKDTITSAMINQFEGKEADQDYKRGVPLIKAHDEL